MSIQTPTSNPVATGLGSNLDVAQLTQLANQFFASLPSGTVGGAELPSGFGPSAQTANSAVNTVTSAVAPQNLVLAGASTPALTPTAVAGNGVPDTIIQGAPAYDHRIGNAVLHVPEARDSTGAVTETSDKILHRADGAGNGYYFLNHAQPTYAAPEIKQDAGVPSDDELRALLARDEINGIQANSHHVPATQTAAPSKTPPQDYYFIQLNQPTQTVEGLDPDIETRRKLYPSSAPFDIHAVRRDFPILQERVNGKPLVWFDNAATTHKPQSVIDRLAYFYRHENSNIHRAAHELAARATDAYEGARQKVADFIGAASAEEIVFVRGATEAINLVANTWGVQNVGQGDEIIVSYLEHHANIVPWQQLAQKVGATIKVIPVDDSGQVILSEYAKLLNPRTKIVAVTQVSNALGTVTPIEQIVAMAHGAGAKTLVDGAQSVSHMRVNVQAIDADFFVFSGHKVFAPTGIGAVYGKRSLLDTLPPWQGGGNMIADVTFERTVFQPPPNRFEAGTGNIADAVGLGAAIDYVQRIGIENIAQYEHSLLEYATHYLAPIKGVRLVGTAAHKASVLSFVLNGYSTEEVGRALNEEGIAVRTGHHCAQPILRRFGLETTVRPSLAFYNTCEEIDRFITVIRRLSAQRN